MTTANQVYSEIPRTAQNDSRRGPRVDLRALYAEWRKLSPNLTAPDENMTERELRIWWSNQKLEGRRPERSAAAAGSSRHGGVKPPLQSWSELQPGEAKFLLRAMREESGDGPAYRANLIGKLAAELWGAPWDRLLGDRLRSRFQVSEPGELAPRQAHELIEELASRIARRDGIEIEEVRNRVKG